MLLQVAIKVHFELVISHGCLFQIQIDEDIFTHHEVVQRNSSLEIFKREFLTLDMVNLTLIQ
jgi:hypothetical protein